MYNLCVPTSTIIPMSIISVKKMYVLLLSLRKRHYRSVYIYIPTYMNKIVLLAEVYVTE